MAKLLLTLKRSTIRSTEKQQSVVRALGLRKRGHSVLQPDNAAIRGMVRAIPHLLDVREVEDGGEA